MEQKDLAQVSQKMTRTEQRINACYQAHPDEFAFGTLEELAALTSTSTASIIRYCRRMGYGGFRAFQEKLREGMRSQVRLPDRIQRQETAEEMSRLRQTVDQNRDCVEQTLAYLTEKQLEQLVQKVADSRRIFVFGMRESLALAHYAYTRLITLRGNVFLLGAGYNGMLEPLLDLNEQDLCLFFLFHRYTSQSRRMVKLVKDRGVFLTMVTSPPTEQISPYADLLLCCHVQTQGIKNSYAAPVCLVDYLCSALTARYSGRVLERLQQVEQLLRGSGMVGE